MGALNAKGDKGREVTSRRGGFWLVRAGGESRTTEDSCGPVDLDGIFSFVWDYCRGDFSRTTAGNILFFCVLVKTARTLVA